MILDYHTKLLELSLKDEDYFSDFGDNFINDKLLLKGLHYPDLPCNKLSVNKKNEITYDNYDACSIPAPLIYLLFEEKSGLKQTVQSHRGRQAIGHSMTFDPNETMISLRQKILRRLEILYMLALQDNSTCYETKTDLSNHLSCVEDYPPNIFWIGQILHCVQDSYSKVHTLRVPYYEIDNILADYTEVNSLLEYTPIPDDTDDFSEKEHFNYAFRLIRYINIKIIDEFKKKFKGEITKDNVKEYVSNFIKDDKDIHDEAEKTKLLQVVGSNPNDLFAIFKLMYFFNFQKNRLLSLYDNNNKQLPSYLNKDKHSNTDPLYPYIVSFYYIPDQKSCGKLFHVKNDTQTSNQKNEPYNIQNCKYILRLYKFHVLNTTLTLQQKIAQFVEYVSVNIFPIPNIFHNYTSSQIIKKNVCLTKS